MAPLTPDATFDSAVYGVALGEGLRHGRIIHVAEETDYRYGLKKELELGPWAKWWCGGVTYHAEFDSLKELEHLGYTRCRLCFGAFHWPGDR